MKLNGYLVYKKFLIFILILLFHKSTHTHITGSTSDLIREDNHSIAYFIRSQN